MMDDTWRRLHGLPDTNVPGVASENGGVQHGGWSSQNGGGGGLGGSESRKDGKTIRYSTYIRTQYSREVKNRNKINRLDVHPLSLSRSSDRITKGFSLSHRIIYNTGRVSQPVCESFSHCTHTQTDRHTNTRRSNKCRMRGQITIFKDPYMVNW
jgi:hypothetical protein